MIGKYERTLNNLGRSFEGMIYLRVSTKDGYAQLLRDIENGGFMTEIDEAAAGANQWTPKVIMLWSAEKRISAAACMASHRGYIEACNVHRIDYEAYKGGEANYYIVNPSYANPESEEIVRPYEGTKMKNNTGFYLV